MKKFHLVFRLLTSVYLVLGLLGYSPPAQAGDPPPPEEVSSLPDASAPSPSLAQAPSPTPTPSGHTIYLKSREFQPGQPDLAALQRAAQPERERVHILVQLDFIPREAAKEELEASGLELLDYVPDYGWIASAPAADPAAVLGLPGVTWAGQLAVDDKLDPAIRAEQWGTWNLAPDGTAAVYVALHQDESMEAGRALVATHGGQIKGEVQGTQMLVVELPKANIQALAGEEAVQWIEPAAPPLTANNDGSRNQIGVDTVQASPYNLDGKNIDVLVYDSGQAGDHVDFGTRLRHGDADSVSDHSTHVAGTVGGSGANSINHGGSALQWRGMAPNADLLSYGTSYSGSGVIFYENVPDIEHDWAQAQNWYGADLGTASIGSNIYQNYYMTACYLMGNYGAASVLIDQIVRGGNATVGVGNKYIATWAAGNERGWTSSCAGAGGGYGLVAPPAGAKNPIHVGGSNTNNNLQYTHTSWGPTDDGRLKPIVTAGACQTSGDYGIRSTDNNPVDAYTVKCGTSMATPAVAGGIALMLQHYRDVYNTTGNFWPSTAKAILMQTARDFGNTGPDYQWGYGLVDIHAAVDLISRRAFRQDSIDDDEVDVYYFIAPSADEDVKVSLAWDDYEATLNAYPALINNLDLELVAPGGTTWRPWILDQYNPADGATHDSIHTDSRNNQEQVQVSAAEEELVGTWIVRVKGTNVPQGPQDYSLACEGCQPLNLGVCQDEVAGTMLAGRLPEGRGPEIESDEETITAGEAWQRTLEAQATSQADDQAAEIEAALEALEAARALGPQAVAALGETLSGAALDLVIDEIAEAREQEDQIANRQIANTELRSAQIGESDEAATLAAQQAAEAAARAQALAQTNSPGENDRAESFRSQVSGSRAPAADLTVGEGCTYATIGAAVAAASAGDTLLIEGGRTFTENVTINKNLTLQGGYNGCASLSSYRTTIDGAASGPVVIVNQGLQVSLQNLDLTNGSTGGEGGGLRFAIGSGSGTLNLSNVHIANNAAQWGGGLWVGKNAEVVGTSVYIYNNTATAYGGGVRLYGGRATLTSSSIHDNNAPIGGGVYATLESGYGPALNLPSYADVYSNEALSGAGTGGGVYMRQGSLSMASNSDLYSNQALQGGGAYLLTTTLTLDGSSSWIYDNTATGNGGGVYAQGSTLNLDDGAELYSNEAGDSGGGAYLDDSNLYSDKASVRYNSADDDGGGIYGTNTSIVSMDLGSYTCLGERCSRLYANTATSYGGGIYAAGSSTVYLYNIFVENNTGNLGGGLYAYDSRVYAYNNLFARNNATGSAGDGIRLYDGASMAGTNNTLAYNNAGGASTGRAIDMWNSDLTLGCSIVWGHTTSINEADQTVSYSDVQGGYAGTGNLDVNPLFVASGSSDYHLQTGSPVIDRCLLGVSPDFDNERRPIVRNTSASPYDMGADEAAGVARVGINGGGCAYATLQQAVNAAEDGDMLQAASGVYFESVDITSGKDITLEGGFDSTCTTPGSGTTRLEGSTSSGSTLDIYASAVVLRDLEVAWGSSTGGGVDARAGAQVTLDNADVLANHGSYGGGVYVDASSALTATNGSEIYDNTATSSGGGAYVQGSFSAYGNASTTRDNCASDGGGFYAPGGQVTLNNARAYLNRAAGSTSKGGGIYVSSNGVVTLTNSAYVYYLNQAYDGAGIYADNATVSMNGAGTTLRDNVASHYGGGVYLANGSRLRSNGGRIGQAGSVGLANEAQRGAGLYVDNSTVEFSGRIQNNVASSYGAGIYATGSHLQLENATVGGTSSGEANQISGSGYGVGFYLYNTHAALSNTVVASNTFQAAGTAYGGGAYVSSSVLTLTHSSVERHLAPSTGGYGAGLYVYNSTVTLDNSQVISNTAGRLGGGLRLNGTNILNVLGGSSISHNTASNGEGGGIAATGAVDINITNATLQYNTASTDGGAIYLGAGTLDLNGWWNVRYNRAYGNGGAVAVMGTADADFYVTDGAQPSYLANNTATGSGGALYVTNNDTVRLYATQGYPLTFNINIAGGYGGGAYADNGAYFDVYGRVMASSNQAGGDGGAFYLAGGSRIWLDDYVHDAPQLLVNRADNGGAIYAQNSPRVRCDGAVFGTTSSGNEARAGSGGALYLGGSTLSAKNCIWRNGTATQHGGAIAAYTSTLTIDADYPAATRASERGVRSPNAPAATACNPLTDECSAMYGNTANSDSVGDGYGGALYVNNSELSVAHTSLHRNSAARGGAIFQEGGSASTRLGDSLIYSNTVSTAFGAGIRTENGAFTLTHTTIANNAGGAGYSQSSTDSAAHNSIAWGNEMGGFLGTYVITTCNIDQSGIAGTDIAPDFISPGAGEDYHLLGSSPAVNACGTGLSPDLDNVPRPVASKYDMGAFEYAYGLEFAPDRSGTGLPGLDVVYTHRITNTGGTTDTFSLAAASSLGWSMNVVPTPSVTLDGGQSTPVTVSVSIPAGTLSGTVDTVVVTATSSKDASLVASVADTTTVGFAPGAAFTPDYLTTNASGTINYTHWLTNTGNAPDTFSLAWSSSQGWGNLLNPGPHPLNPNQSVLIVVQVTAPAGSGLVDTTVVTATSTGGAGPVAVHDTTSAFTPGAAFTPDHAQTVPVESVLTYTHILTNTGNATDTFQLASASSQGWGTLLDPGPFTLAAGATQTVRLGVSVLPASAGLTDTSFITVTSDGGAGPVSVRDETATYQAGVALTPLDGYTERIQAGESITYTHLLTNTGEYTDTFDVTISAGLGWATLLNSGPFTLTAGGAAELRVRVDAPLGSGGLTDTVTLEASSRAGSAVSAAVTDTTIVPRTYGVVLVPDHAQSINPGELVTYTHWLTNTGNGTDKFELALSSSRHWAKLVDPGPFKLQAGTGITVHVRVKVPTGSGGLSEITRLVVTSELSPSVQASATDTTTAIYAPGIVLMPPGGYTQSIIPPASFTYTHWLTNTGNGADTFDLEFSSSQGWTALADPGPFSLGAGQGISLHVQVNVPSNSGGLVDTGLLTATAQTSGQSATVTDVTTATHVAGVKLAPPDGYTLSVPPGDTYVYMHHLGNAGNGPDTFAVTLTSSLGWATLLDSGPFPLHPGEVAEVRVSVQVPGGLISGTLTDVAIVTATSQADPGMSTAVTDTTAAGFAPGGSLTPEYVTTQATEGLHLYDHTLVNTGNYTDSFDLVLTSSQGWGSLSTASPITLGPSESHMVQVLVTVPSGASGLTDLTVVTATSQGGAGPLVVRDITAAFEPSLAFTPDYDRQLAIGESFTYTHWLTNTAVTTDTINLVLDSSRGWAVLLDPGPFTLAAGAGITVRVVVTAPFGSGGLTDIACVTAAALLGTVPSAYVTDTSSVPYTPGVELVPDHEELASAGSAIVYAHTLTNAGDGPATFTVTLHSSQGWATLLDPGPFSLAASESTNVRVQVDVPTDTYALTVDVTTLTATVESGGLSATAVDTTRVACEALAGASFDFSPASPLPGRPVTFTGSVAAGSQLISFEWNWDDGSAVQAGSPAQHSFAAGSYRVLMTATNACSWVTATRTVAVTATYGVALSPGQALYVTPGETAILTHVLTNTGNSPDSFVVTASSAQGWLDAYAPATTEELAPGQSATLVLTLSLPAATGGLVDTLSVRARSQAEAGRQAVAFDTITAIPSVMVTRPITGPGTYVFSDTCASLSFASDADRGGLTAVTVTLVYSYPTLQLPPDPTRPLPRRYTIVGDVTGGFTATLSLCYTQADLDAASIADANTLRLYRYVGAGSWVSYTSAVSTATQLITGEIHDLSAWAIGAPGHDPTVVMLSSARAAEDKPVWIGLVLITGLLWAAGWQRRRRRT